MSYNAAIIGGDIDSAQAIQKIIEIYSEVKCVALISSEEIQNLFHRKYLFYIYDISNENSQKKEQIFIKKFKEYFPETLIFSVGSLVKENLILSQNSILLLDKSSLVKIVSPHGGRIN